MLVLVVMIGLLCCVYVAVQAYQIQNHQRFPWRNYIMSHPRRPATLTDVSYISSWMTFDYINKVFNLPSTYLQQDLQIQNPKYPFITLAQYAKATNTSSSAIIGNVQTILRTYLTSSTPQ